MPATLTEDKQTATGATGRGRGGRGAKAAARTAAPALPAAVERSPLAAAAAAALDSAPVARASVPLPDLEDEAQLRAALQTAPDDPVLWGSLGRLLRKRGDNDEAIACYRKAVAAPQAVGYADRVAS